MKKILLSEVCRGLSLLILGILLTVFSDNIPELLVMATGVLIALAGVVTVVAGVQQSDKKATNLLFIVTGAASAVLGGVLISMPGEFVKSLMLVLAIVLVVVSGIQLYDAYMLRRRKGSVHELLFLPPVATFALGVLIAVKPALFAKLPFLLAGVGFIVYGLVELYLAWCAHRLAKRLARENEPEEVMVEVIDEE